MMKNISIRWGKSNTLFMKIQRNLCCRCTADLTAESSHHENCEGLMYPLERYKSVVSEFSLSSRILRNKVLTLCQLRKTPANPAHISVNTPKHMSEIYPRNNIYTRNSVFMSQEKQTVKSANHLALTVSPFRPSHIHDCNRNGVLHKGLSNIQNYKQPTSFRPMLKYF